MIVNYLQNFEIKIQFFFTDEYSVLKKIQVSGGTRIPLEKFL